MLVQGNIMIRSIKAAIGASLLVGAIFASSAASAADITFLMKNNHPNALEVELYSQDRDHIWPGNGEVYLFDDGEDKSVALSCQKGERICYGAWISGDKTTYWGVGPGNSEACDDCCYTCEGGTTEEITLDP